MGQRRSAGASAAVRPLRPVPDPPRSRDARSLAEHRDDGPADRLLADITQLLVSQGSLQRVLEAVSDALREIVPYDTLTLYRADLALRVLRPVLVRDRWADEILAMGPLAFGQGVAGRAAEVGEPQLVDDVLLDARSEPLCR